MVVHSSPIDRAHSSWEFLFLYIQTHKTYVKVFKILTLETRVDYFVKPGLIKCSSHFLKKLRITAVI
eukprot:UN25913